MAKKKASTTDSGILADFRARVEAGDSLSKAQADMKRELRRTSDDPDAALATLLDIAQRAHQGSSFDDIAEHLAAKANAPAPEEPLA